MISRVALAIADGDDSFGVLAGRSTSVRLAIAFAGLLVVIRLALALLAMRASVSLSTRVGVEARRDVADAYLHASWGVQQAEAGGRLQELIMSFAGSKVGVANAFASILNSSLSLTALVIGSILINPTATLVVMVALGVLGTVLAPVRRRIRHRARAASTAQMEFATSVSELGALGMEMQAFGVRDQFVRRIDRVISAHANSAAQAGIAQGMLHTAVLVSGLYGVIAYAVLQRRREIGIRMALGAELRDIRGLFLRRGLVLVGVGMAIGLAGAVGFSRFMQSLLFGVPPLDPIAFTAMPLVLAAAAMLASYLPARRAIAVDPAETLRAE